MFRNVFRMQVLERVKREHPDARLNRAAFTFGAWNLWCLSFPNRPGEPAVLLGFSDAPELEESTVRTAAQWAETTGCSSFRIYIPEHAVVPGGVQAILKEEVGEVVRVPAPINPPPR